MWVQAAWHSPPGHSAPATQRPAGIPSRTVYGLIAYLCQIAERISSDPFDPSPLILAVTPLIRVLDQRSVDRVVVVEDDRGLILDHRARGESGQRSRPQHDRVQQWRRES